MNHPSRPNASARRRALRAAGAAMTVLLAGLPLTAPAQDAWPNTP